MSWQLLAARTLSHNSRSRTHNAFNASRPTPRSISSSPSLSSCIPPSYSSSYRTHLLDATNASYMPHLDASASAWHHLLRCSPHTYVVLYLSPSLMDVHCPSHCPPSVLATGTCTPSTSRFPISRSVTTRIRRRRRHLPTTKVTNETNDLAYTPTDANTNLNARSMADDSSHNALCLSLEFKMLLDDSASAC